MNNDRRQALQFMVSSLRSTADFISQVIAAETSSNMNRPESLQQSAHGLESDAALHFLRQALEQCNSASALISISFSERAEWYHQLHSDILISFISVREQRELPDDARLPTVVITSNAGLTFTAHEGPRLSPDIGGFGVIRSGFDFHESPDVRIHGKSVNYRFNTEESFLRLVNYTHELEGDYQEAIILDEIAAGNVAYEGDDEFRDLLDDMMLSKLATRQTLESFKHLPQRPKLVLVK